MLIKRASARERLSSDLADGDSQENRRGAKCALKLRYNIHSSTRYVRCTPRASTAAAMQCEAHLHRNGECIGEDGMLCARAEPIG